MARVRRHRRRTSSGRHVVVRQHQRRDLPYQGARKLLNRQYRDPHPYRSVFRVQRAGRNIKNAWRYGRRKRRAAAATVAVLGVVELAAWLLLRGVGVVATTIAVVLGGVAAVSMSRTATDATPYGGKRRAPSKLETGRASAKPAGRHRRA